MVCLWFFKNERTNLTHLITLIRMARGYGYILLAEKAQIWNNNERIRVKKFQ